MIEIDSAMFEATKQAARERYITDKVREYERNDPKRFACAGETKFREFIELSLQKAEKYNMLADREVNGLRTMMYALGSYFDEDPMYPWARFKRFPDKNPTSKEEPESFIYLEKIYRQFYTQSVEVQGETNQYLLSALARIQKLQIRDLLPFRETKEIVRLLEYIYPEHYKLIPVEALQEHVIPAAGDVALQYGLAPALGKVLFSGLIFFCGSGILQDPLYWNFLETLEQVFDFSGEQRERKILSHLQSYSV